MKIRYRTMKALALLIVASLGISAVPTMIVGLAPVENASAQVGGGDVRVGWLQDFQNWNPLTIEMVSDWVATYLIYSSLFQYDEDWNVIENHLATGYYQEEGVTGNMSTWINLTDTAYFRNADDPEDKSHPVTAEDVKFTIDLIQANLGGSWDYYTYNISDVYVTDTYQVRIDTEYPKATLIDDLVWIPILPKYEWETYLPNKILGNMKPSDLIGSGPFYFDSMSLGQWYKFNTAPNFHGAADYPDERDIDFEGIIYTVYTATAPMVVAIEGGEEDVVDLTGVQGLAWDALGEGQPEIIKQETVELGIYDVAINAIPLEMRTQTYGNGNVILLDDVVRKALGMTMNRESLVNDYFDGRPVQADTVLNPGFWHANLTNYTEVLPYNPAWARENLTAAGYADVNSDDILEVTETCDAYLLYGASVGDPLKFRLRVPDSDPGYAAVGSAWVAWGKAAGIELDYEVQPEGLMVSKDWYKADFDIWVWSWYWGPEPLSNLACWLSREVVEGGYNCVGPICPGGLDEPDGWWWFDEENRVAYCEFDEVFDLAMRTPDRDERKLLVDDLQVRIYDTWTEFPPIHPNGLYAMSTAHYDGWGDWEDHLARTIISDMLWVWYDLSPVSDNNDPVFDTPPVTMEVEVNQPATFSIGVSDAEGDPIRVNWSFGDGSDFVYDDLTGDTTVEQAVTQTHTYTVAGEYTLRVGIKDDQHDFERADSATVRVLLEINAGPEFGIVVVDPQMAYVDDVVTWTAPAMDREQGDDGAGLLFTWDWGDDTPPTVDLKQPVENDTFVSSVRTHAWSEAGSYYVSVSVWDGFDVETNDIHNVTYVEAYEVLANSPPTDPAVSAIEGVEGVEVPCVAIASDLDPDVLTFTWEWDDGTYTVTTRDTSSAPGVPVMSVVAHTWSAAGTYPVTVYVDDGEVDHNVSTTIDAVILASGEEAPPGSISLTVTPYPSYIDEELTLNISAYDANGDALTVTIEFGDGEDDVDTTAGGDGLQYVEFVHTYIADDTYSVIVHVDDGTTNVTATFDLVVTPPMANRPPTISLQTSYSFFLDVEKELRLKISDPDGDDLSVWYDWGDESQFALGDPDDGFAASHTYYEVGTFTLTVWADDGVGFNVSAEASVNVQEANRKPTVEGLVKMPSKSEYDVDEVITFNVTIKDKEGDLVNVTITYGDGLQDSIEIADLDADTNRTVQFEHTYSEAGEGVYNIVVTVKDDQLHAEMVWNTKETTVTVKAEQGGTNMLLVAGIALAVIVALAVALMLMKRRKKGEGEAVEGTAGMEGMAPPEEPQASPPFEPPS